MKKSQKIACAVLLGTGLILSNQAVYADPNTGILEAISRTLSQISGQITTLYNTASTQLTNIYSSTTGTTTALTSKIIPTLLKIEQAIDINSDQNANNYASSRAQGFEKIYSNQQSLQSNEQQNFNALFALTIPNPKQPLKQSLDIAANNDTNYCEGGGNCYNALAVLSLTGNDTLIGQQLNAAQQFTKYLSGIGVQIPPPQASWLSNLTAQQLQYINTYKMLRAVQSTVINSTSKELALRQGSTTAGQTPTSALSTLKQNTFYGLISDDAQNAIAKIPVLGWIYVIQYDLTSLVTIAYQGLQKLDDIILLLDASDTLQLENFSYTAGTQMYQQAQSSKSN